MAVDIIYSGFATGLKVKFRSQKYFRSLKYTQRNHVFVNHGGDNIYHVKRNKIHVFVAKEKEEDISEICAYIKNVLSDICIGIKTDNKTYKTIRKDIKTDCFRL